MQLVCANAWEGFLNALMAEKCPCDSPWIKPEESEGLGVPRN